MNADPLCLRVDLHCHSNASNEADEAVLNAIQCPESYSTPDEVYRQAKRRGMDLVTVTDHDSIAGVETLLDRDDVLVGEELTCWFPEDRCKMHVLVWGITAAQHDELQRVADDIYAVAEYVEHQRIAHAVAHPVYRQNDVLERWHLERLILMFKGFELLNGAHSALHRQSLEPLLTGLTPGRIDEFSARHGLAPRWPEPHVKAFTGGSDDHGLFNIGRTWTEFQPDAGTIDDVLECLRTARCRPGGEAGSSLKLAHNFFSVGIRYFGRQVLPRGQTSLTGSMLGLLVGDEGARLRKRDLIKFAVKHRAARVARFVAKPFRREKPKTGAALLADLFVDACRARAAEHPQLADATRQGLAPLGEHEAMFRFVSAINRDLAGGIAGSVAQALGAGRVGGVFDAISAVAAQQFVMLPYYFALSHQNRERQVLARVTGHGRTPTAGDLRVGVFTDTFDDVNGVVRFVREMGTQATLKGRSLQVATCTDQPTHDAPYRTNFKPLVSCAMPMYRELKLTLPPLVDILEWADRQQFDAIHVDTPGPMGLCGWLVAKMLRIPLLGTYHTDFPQYVKALSGGDYRLTATTAAYARWFYGNMATVFSRSKHYQATLRGIGVGDDRLCAAPPFIDDDKFNPRHRDPSLWAKHGVIEPRRLLYVGRVSAEKNLALLADVFVQLCKTRRDTALVIVGDGPFTETLRKRLAGLPVYFLGYRGDAELAPLYASSDLFVFPSRTDTLGQVILESLASGLPALVSNEGGPQEVVDDALTGRVLPSTDAAAWLGAIHKLLNDETLRQRLSRTAVTRMARYTPEAAFEAFWDEHLRRAVAVNSEAETAHSSTASPVLAPV